jgi:DNA-binding LytR/AlgR family response regulator
MKVVIIEDEKLSAMHLATLLKKADAGIQIIQYIDTVKTSIELFHQGLSCDLLFMDIHLADGISFEIFNHFNLDTPVIFTTAYDQYAIQAFKQNSIDYLLKPVSLQDVQFSLNKFGQQQQRINKQLIETFENTYKDRSNKYKTRFLVKAGERIDTIPTSDIHHFTTKDGFSFLVTHTGKRYIIEYSLEQLENILEPNDFFRINRKIIIHIQAIEKVNPYFNSRLSVIANNVEGEAQVVSRERVADFKKWLDK